MTNGPALVFYLLVLILPIAALVSRRIPMKTTGWMIAAWVAIFGIGYLLLCNFT